MLVVEDELLSRLHAVSLVEDAGYTAVEASNALELMRHEGETEELAAE